MNSAKKTEKKLFSCIDELEQNRHLCFYNPKTDFIRNCKLSFWSIIKCLLVMEAHLFKKSY